jgi:hypothetical protein
MSGKEIEGMQANGKNDVVIYPAKMRKGVQDAYNNNDHARLESMRSLLPKDSDYDKPIKAEGGLQLAEQIQAEINAGRMNRTPGEIQNFITNYDKQHDTNWANDWGTFATDIGYTEKQLGGHKDVYDIHDYGKMTAETFHDRMNAPLQPAVRNQDLSRRAPVLSPVDMPTTTDTGSSDYYENKFGIDPLDVRSGKGYFNKFRMNAPSFYNLGMGILGTPESVTRRYMSPNEMRHTDMSATDRADIRRQQAAMDNQKFRRTRGQGLGYLAQNAQRARSQMERINQAEARRFYGIDQYNVGQRNQAQQFNIGLANQYDMFDAQNRAARQRFLAKGLEQQGELGALDEQKKYMMSRDARKDQVEYAKLALEGKKMFGDDTKRYHDWLDSIGLNPYSTLSQRTSTGYNRSAGKQTKVNEDKKKLNLNLKKGFNKAGEFIGDLTEKTGIDRGYSKEERKEERGVSGSRITKGFRAIGDKAKEVRGTAAERQNRRIRNQEGRDVFELQKEEDYKRLSKEGWNVKKPKSLKKKEKADTKRKEAETENLLNIAGYDNQLSPSKRKKTKKKKRTNR